MRVTVLPLILFPTLTILSCKFIVPPIFVETLQYQCTLNAYSPYFISYTGYFPAVDAKLCLVAAFFHGVMDMSNPLGVNFLSYIMGTSSIYVILPCLEALRPRNKLSLLASPMVWLVLSAVTPLGLAMTIYCLVLVLGVANSTTKGDPHRRGVDSQDCDDDHEGFVISGGRVESIIPGVVLGVAVPSFALFEYKNPRITVLWPFFPFYILVVRKMWDLIPPRPLSRLSSRRPANDKSIATVQLILLGSFFLSSYFHITLVWPLLLEQMQVDGGGLKAFFVPQYSTPHLPHPYSTELIGERMLAMLQWDFIFASISMISAMLWYSRPRSLLELVLVMVGMGVGSVVVGPGAVIPVVLLWTEARVTKIASASTLTGPPGEGKVEG